MPPGERIRKVEAVVISHRDFGEADRLVKIYSRQEGKMTAIAKGVRRIRSRKAAHLEPFTHASLVLAVGRTFWVVTQADTLGDFPHIRADLKRTARAAYVLELADLLSTEYQADDAFFRLLLETLRRIDGNGDIFNPVCYYELHALDLAGFKPELFHCVSCKKEIQPEDQFFSLRQGGALCPSCGAAAEGGVLTISMEALRYLRHFQRSAYKKMGEVNIPESVRNEMRRLLDRYVSAVAERRLNAPGFYDQITRYSAGG